MQTSNIAQNSGYALLSVNVDGNAVSRSTTCTVTNVTSNKTVNATFGLYGDANNNGEVNIGDVVVVRRYIQGYDDGHQWLTILGDVNADGVIDVYDLAILRGKTVGVEAVAILPYTGKVVIFGSETVDLSAINYQYFTTGETKALAPSSALTKDGYVLAGWTTTPGGTTIDYALGANYTANNNATLYAVWQEVATWNKPVLATGLTPVNWNGTTWVTTDEENWDYNYNSVATATHSTVAGNGNGKWANAQTVDGSLYVWIPRYTYKIESGYHSDVDSWNSLDTPGTGKILIKFSNGTTDDTIGEYIKHPAFTFGSTELTGFWVAKYEASRNDATVDSAGTGTTASSKPNVMSWRSLTLSEMFDYSYNSNRSLESHMMKNTEWGAVAYLTNAIGRIPYVNNSNTYITGNAGGSQNATGVNGVTNAWNTANGVKASTTHNVYGIYDMSGGGQEFVATYLNNGHTNLTNYASSLVNSYNTYGGKYVDVYIPSESDSLTDNYEKWSTITGDAMYETSYRGGSSAGSWDNDSAFAMEGYGMCLLRGGGAGGSSAGIFNFSGGEVGGSAYNFIGFRVTLAPEAFEIPVGAYVSYTPGTNIPTSFTGGTYSPGTYTSGWKVFKNNNGQLDIISAEKVGNLTLSGEAGYANSVYILNKISEGYVNSAYATGGRSLGSTPDWTETTVNSSKSLGKITSAINYGSSGFPYTDELYRDDEAIINTAVNGSYPLRHSVGYAWIASRNISTSSSTGSSLYVRTLYAGGSINGNSFYNKSTSNVGSGSNASMGIRPVISLKPGLKIVSGDGLTPETAYVLQ